MRTRAPLMQRIATRLQSIPLPLMEWTSIMVILLVVTVNTFSEVLPIAKTTPSIPGSGQGCLRFKRNSHECKRHTPKTCLHFRISGICKLPFSTDDHLGGCVDWNPDSGDCTDFILKNKTPKCADNSTPDD